MSAWPAAYVDVWPADGGSLSLNSVNGPILSVSTFKDIWDTNSGNFEILLPPGGPYGTGSTPQWVDIITPMSLVVIGLQRNAFGLPRSSIVMVGVVTMVEQDTEWQYGASVRRVCRVAGQDFSYFFNQQCAYCTTLLRFLPAGLGGLAAALSANGLASGTPDQLATDFYNKIMAGSSGIMSGTKFQYQSGQLSWAQLVRTQIQPYPNVPVEIPCSWNYLAVDGTWTERFQMLLPFPWYEFTVTTAVGGSIGLNDVSFFPQVGPTVIARPLPLPRLTDNGSSLDLSLWSKLPIAMPDGNMVIAHDETYDVSDVRNFYMLNPSYLNTLQGISNQQIAPWSYTYAGWVDVPSIQRYGYKPRVSNIYWLADPLGNQAQQNAGNDDEFQQMVSELALVPVGYHEPSPLMAHGSARLNLRPDIVPGVRFQYSPDKANTQWLAYVRSVGHRFVFGRESVTTLGLCRSLPLSIYSDEGTLLEIHTGKAAKVDGNFVSKYSGIVPFNLDNATTDLASLSQAFTTPGSQ